MPKIEFLVGEGKHQSNWGLGGNYSYLWSEYTVEGLETYQIENEFEENQSDKFRNYQGYIADPPAGTMFTISENNRKKKGMGATTHSFYICRIMDEDMDYLQGCDLKAEYGNGFCRGRFRIVSTTEGKDRVKHLKQWWEESDDKSFEFALHCEMLINRNYYTKFIPIR